MGGLWQALVMGFGGVRPMSDRLCIDPHVPLAWGMLTVRVRFRGARVRIAMEPDAFSVHADARFAVQAGSHCCTLEPGLTRFRKALGTWEPA
jgi:trehalose/maltose hydrolase-like predicted phosphorylase